MSELATPRRNRLLLRQWTDLLEDDALISSFKVTADRLLEQRGPSEVVLVMHVSTKARTRTPSTQWLD